MSTTVTPQLEPEVLRSRIERFRKVQSEIVTQVRRVIVGQGEVLVVAVIHGRSPPVGSGIRPGG